MTPKQKSNKLTEECGDNDKHSLIDIPVFRYLDKFHTSVSRKPTLSSVLTNYEVFYHQISSTI